MCWKSDLALSALTFLPYCFSNIFVMGDSFKTGCLGTTGFRGVETDNSCMTRVLSSSAVCLFSLPEQHNVYTELSRGFMSYIKPSLTAPHLFSYNMSFRRHFSIIFVFLLCHITTHHRMVNHVVQASLGRKNIPLMKLLRTLTSDMTSVR